MRVFVAIYPPKHVRDYFRDSFRAFDKQKRNLRQVDLEQVHLNLRFIGAKVSADSKQQIAEALLSQVGSYPNPEIKITGLKFGFPRQQNPRVLFAEVARNDELDELVDRLHKTIRGQKLRDTIIWKQRNDSHYHFTIARLKDSATKSTGREVRELLERANLELPEPFVADQMHLVQSVMIRKSRPKYRKLETIAL